MTDSKQFSRQIPFDSVAWRRRVVTARGTGAADVILGGGKVLNVFTGELIEASVAISGGIIAGVGNYGQGWETWDCRGKIIAPSFVDPHMHIESSMLWIDEFARSVVPHGTGAVICDPHEIANVAGLPGVAAMREAAQGLPLHVRFTAPSCVPASAWESPGARFDVDEIISMLAWPETLGLGELMDVRAVLSGDASIALKLREASGQLIDGHVPGLTGRGLQAYLTAGIAADHESTTLQEAQAKLAAGLMLMIREGTAEQNLADLLPAVTDKTWPRCCFCSDDRDCLTLLQDGHMDDVVRLAIRQGLEPIRAYILATWNAAHHWRLATIGAVAPGYEANLNVLNSLEEVDIYSTFFQGRMVARHGEMIDPISDRPAPAFLQQSINLAPVSLEHFRLSPNTSEAIEIVPGQIVTKKARIEPSIEDGFAVSDPSRDLLKLVCIERHRATGRTGVGYVTGFGLRKGAMASTIAHDAHNIIVVGTSDVDMLQAVATVAESQGGFAVVADGQVLAHLPLPIGGIMSDLPLLDVAAMLHLANDAAQSLGCPLDSPFGTLTFMALSVIPAVRVTDKGFIHVT